MIKSLPLVAFLITGFLISTQASKPETWNLWPDEAPGERLTLSDEFDRTTPEDKLVAGRRLIRLHNVSVPTVTIYKPAPKLDTGAALVIAPGGGHWILAMDLEGTEIAEWANSIGLTAILLKYRVPGGARDPEKKWLSSVQDGQRAMSLVRGRADEIGIDPDRIGIIGFSAGGSPVKYTALTSKRLYKPVDKYDAVSFRPNFAAPIYSGTLPEEAELSKDCPPFFMVIAHDDRRPIEVAEMYIALKKAGISAELHIFEEGGHGYGLRKTGLPVASWPDLMEAWMRQKGFLERKDG
ncbi:MAG: alpha/beta hydrolase [Verrucomicrobia bacterium]|nr:alpha/beta hydrolase [Verrucomicrobiota bacterium]